MKVWNLKWDLRIIWNAKRGCEPWIPKHPSSYATVYTLWRWLFFLSISWPVTIYLLIEYTLLLTGQLSTYWLIDCRTVNLTFVHGWNFAPVACLLHICPGNLLAYKTWAKCTQALIVFQIQTRFLPVLLVVWHPFWRNICIIKLNSSHPYSIITT